MCDRGEDLAHLGLMLCGLAAVLQASGLDGVAFDPFSFQEDGLTPAEVDISRRQVADALVVADLGVVGDEVADLLLEITRQIVVLDQNAVLEGLVPALDLSCVWGSSGARVGCELTLNLKLRDRWGEDRASRRTRV
jgi:hypothetical protein